MWSSCKAASVSFDQNYYFMQFKPLFLLTILISFSCHPNANSTSREAYPASTGNDDNPYAHVKNIPLPQGFMRQQADPNSFAGFLQNTGLKKDKAVCLYNGELKFNQTAQFAVLDISCGNKDLQQCADAVMRLRAEFLFAKKDYDNIIFFDNDHMMYKFYAPYTRDNLLRYLNRVFGMCGSASLSKQLKPVADLSAIQPGDVLIRGGFPGHAVIVMDVAVSSTGKKIYLLAQSYMPAQDIHILNNPMDEDLSPWYEVNDADLIQTPEYTFHRNELKRW